MDFTQLLDRQNIANSITQILQDFDKQYNNVNFKKGIYLHGSPGSGKSYFIEQLLKKHDYDVIKYDAGDVRNKSLIDTITSNNVSNRNVLDMMSGKRKKIVIIMDEIDGMNNGDKGGINALIKLIRQKKTKKQKMESFTLNPVICIGTYYMDKKIKELMKVCHIFEMKTPSQKQMHSLLNSVIPKEKLQSKQTKQAILEYIQGDLRKLSFIEKIFQNNSQDLSQETLENIFQQKSCNEDSKQITNSLLKDYISFDDHNRKLNDNDRTIVALLYHENLIDILDKLPPQQSREFYIQVLENMCFADYFDRITFQNQIWIFNEMSSLIKTFYNNYLLHKEFVQPLPNPPKETRFTKVLTKYSTEYNNNLFLSHLCQELNMDKKDCIAFFQELRIIYQNEGQDFLGFFEQGQLLEELFDGYSINKLDIKRIYRFLDKIVKKGALVEELDD